MTKIANRDGNVMANQLESPLFHGYVIKREAIGRERAFPKLPQVSAY